VRTRLFISALFLLGPAAAPLSAQTHRVTHTYVLGGDGGWAYIALDSVGHRLFIARQDRIMVVSADSGTLLGGIRGLDRAHGVAFDDAARRGFATSGADSQVTNFDLRTLAVISKTTAAIDDDGIFCDPTTRRIYTMNGDAHSASVIDPASGRRVGDIPLGG
jgi:DNA-binding beta-propeller fold protein YncE